MKAAAPSRRTKLALAVGLGGATLVFAATFPFRQHFDVTLPALLVLVPITVASVLGGWKVSLPVAGFAAALVAFFLPPIGDIRVHLARDVISLAALFVVGLVVGIVAGRGRDTAAVPDEPLLDERRVMLLRNVSHDLRNPLNTIQVATDLLAADGNDEARRLALLGVVADESRRLDRIVGNMLSASRIQAGALLPRLERSHLPSLVDDAVRRFAGTRDHPITVDVPPELPDVFADPVQIDQVLSNLLDNAVAHSPGERPVAVSARRLGERIEIAVTDEGPGFEPTMASLGPRPFRSDRPDRAGVGLGLTVCGSIVDAHGGTLSLANDPAGGGRVAFTLEIAS